MIDFNNQIKSIWFMLCVAYFIIWFDFDLDLCLCERKRLEKILLKNKK